MEKVHIDLFLIMPEQEKSAPVIFFLNSGIGIIYMSFIRAPYIAETYEGVQILAWADGKAAAARQGNQLVTAFHPEVNDDVRVHQYFLDIR